MIKKLFIYFGVFVLTLFVSGFIYVLYASPSDVNFDKIKIGDSVNVVTNLMGQPQNIDYSNPEYLKKYGGVEYEYQYYLWPIPVVFSVGFNKNVVSRKDIFHSP